MSSLSRCSAQSDDVATLTYPSGRIVTYARDTMGRITSVTTKKDSGSPAVTVAPDVEYMPVSRLLKALDYGNGLNDWNTFTADYEVDVLGLYDGSTDVCNVAHTRSDELNLTNLWDNVNSAKNQSLWYNGANQLQNADGPWGSRTYYYDGVGNRTHEIATPPGGGASTTRVHGYGGSDNRVSDVMIGATTERAFTYDNAGNITQDSRSGTAHAYTYNNRNRLHTVTVAGSLRGTYTYNGLEQLAIRVTTNQTPAGTTHFIHDIFGNVIAETAGGGATGSTGTVREYIWLYETEIAPTMASRTEVDRPLAVVNAVNTVSPVLWFVHVDHLNRPKKMTNSSKASVWDADWAPWGAPYAITGSATLDARFPGQWYQLEAGLHYNWHRHYDPSLGRYTQPDPLGFVDGPSVFAYARNSPQTWVDLEGRYSREPPGSQRRRSDPTLGGGGLSEGGGAGGGGGAWGGTRITPAPALRQAPNGMPPIFPPNDPGGGDCVCNCRAGSPSDVLSYRFGRSRAPSCAAAAKIACKKAGERCSTAGGNVHHSEAKCSDGSMRSGSGRVNGSWRQ